MSRASISKGFTLVELLIVVVIIGILASIAIPKFQNTKGKAFTASLKSDLRNLAVAEEAYAYEYQSYTNDTTFLKFSTSPSVALTFVTVAANGWSATTTHVNASPVTCGVFFGPVPPPLAATVAEGQVACE
ncbi:MAG: prepilin-type N-terminal cleavage/methylation domain-containing protein [Anaerolineae bacterium]|nr:prepilin-type N-terminal cleavage/methylation domain-containing protein [Gemmatimonadaceae bacterium]